MTIEQRRQVASLETVPGYKLILDTVVKPAEDEALSKLTTSSDRDVVWKAAVELQLVRRLHRELLALPAAMVEELINEGDEVYGQ
jgi:hypothetical protein